MITIKKHELKKGDIEELIKYKKIQFMRFQYIILHLIDGIFNKYGEIH